MYVNDNGYKKETKILEEWEEKMKVAVKCCLGDGIVYVNECNTVLIDPSLVDNTFYENYKFKTSFVVALPLLEAISKYEEMNLNFFDINTLPNPIFWITKDGAYQPKLAIKHGGVHRITHNTWSFCLPMAWFALVYGVGPLFNNKDPCTLEVKSNNKKGLLMIKGKNCPESLVHKNTNLKYN